MRIVVTGTEGQVARSLAERGAAHSDLEVVLLGRPQLDLTDAGAARAAIRAAKPHVVISAAAYTAVDLAEDEPAKAFAINADGAGAVAAGAADCGAPVIDLSTDYVFAGDKPGAYAETDPTGPQGVYGASKLAGEQMVAAANPRHVILRTAWVYSPFGRNFLKTMLTLAQTRDTLRVVADQHGNPTSALDIADAILHIVRRLAEPPAGAFGTFHLAGTGATTWSGFARRIFAESAALGGRSPHIEDIATSDYPTKAKRPSNSALDCGRLAGIYGWTAPHWEESTASVVRRLTGK